MLEKLKEIFRGRPREREDDVADDRHLAQSRDTGGADRQDGDAGSTTGTGISEEYVGRVAGQDEGAGDVTGAEARGDTGREQRRTGRP